MYGTVTAQCLGAWRQWQCGKMRVVWEQRGLWKRTTHIHIHIAYCLKKLWMKPWYFRKLCIQFIIFISLGYQTPALASISRCVDEISRHVNHYSVHNGDFNFCPKDVYFRENKKRSCCTDSRVCFKMYSRTLYLFTWRHQKSKTKDKTSSSDSTRKYRVSYKTNLKLFKEYLKARNWHWKQC